MGGASESFENLQRGRRIEKVGNHWSSLILLQIESIDTTQF